MPPPTKRRRTEYRQTSTRSHARFHSSHDAPLQTAASTPSPGGAPNYDPVRGHEAPLGSALQERDTLLERRLDLGVGSLDAVTGNLNPSSNASPNRATSLLSSASQDLSHTVGDLTSPVNNLAQNAGAALSGSSVAKLPNELSQTASSVGSSVGSTVENASNDLGQTVSSVGTAANFALDGATENLADGASTLVSGAVSAVSTAASEISQAATTLGSATNDIIGNAGEILLAALSSTTSTSFHSFVTSSTTEVRILSTPTSQIRFEVPSASSLQLPLPVSSALSEVNSLLSTLGISGGAVGPATSSTSVPSSTPYTTPTASISASSTGSSSQALSTSTPSQLASTTTSSASLLHSIPIFSGNFSTSHTHASQSGSFSHASTTAPSRSFAADLSSSLGSTRTQGFWDTTTAYAHHTTLPASTQSSAYAGAAAPSAGSDAASNGPPPAGTIAGGVVGGAAGLAVLLFIALLFVRWYRQRSNHAHRPLPASSASPDNLRGADVSSTPRLGMAERAGLAPFMIAALPARLRPQSRHRHQQLEGTDEWTGASGEKGFTKLAGRKLPSQFSGGSTNVNPAWHAHWPSARTPSPSAPLTAGFESGVHGRGRSDGSHEESYRDSVPDLADDMLLSPGPQRRITVHHGGPYSTESTLNARSLARLSQMATAGQDVESNPFLPPAPRVYDRSSTPLSYTSSGPEGSSHRGSRFAEDV